MIVILWKTLFLKDQLQQLVDMPSQMLATNGSKLTITIAAKIMYLTSGLSATTPVYTDSCACDQGALPVCP
jgi:hypothetical protein